MGRLPYQEEPKLFARSIKMTLFASFLSLLPGIITLNQPFSLDLTAASRAYLLEPHWNPMIEEQALCRVHRVGQRRNVSTIRYLIRDTFEEVWIHTNPHASLNRSVRMSFQVRRIAKLTDVTANCETTEKEENVGTGHFWTRSSFRRWHWCGAFAGVLLIWIYGHIGWFCVTVLENSAWLRMINTIVHDNTVSYGVYAICLPYTQSWAYSKFLDTLA